MLAKVAVDPCATAPDGLARDAPRFVRRARTSPLNFDSEVEYPGREALIGAPTKTRWPFARRHKRDQQRSLPCSQPITSDDDALCPQGQPLHADCAPYSRRRR